VSFDLRQFGISEMLRCGREVRAAAAAGDGCMELAASAVVRYLYDAFRSAEEDNTRQCVLVRFYKTHPYGLLEPDLQHFADALLGAPPRDPGIECLTLLATVGDEPEWCDRHRSRGHRAIPLASEELVEEAPMIAQLFRGFGIDVRQVVRPGAPLLQATGSRSFDVFHVAEALGSPHIPAQAGFVEPYGVRSVVGFGGALRSGELFAVILFARVPIAAQTADRFRNIALDVKYALFNIGNDAVFLASGAAPRGAR
jgi:hypothetical protein